ncbi:spore coat protein U domain-containing protein [Pantoea agglomerans]|uniref:spore coat protein U domain-containing protein n=1 Tax=Enterobacter agglomerans TaxID=549 RepID=UPI003AAA69B0
MAPDGRQHGRRDVPAAVPDFPAGGLTWVAGSPLSQTGTGSTQSLNYSAEINPDQTNQPAGRYSDTVTVTVSY